jgi:hypothetical protein
MFVKLIADKITPSRLTTLRISPGEPLSSDSGSDRPSGFMLLSLLRWILSDIEMRVQSLPEARFGREPGITGDFNIVEPRQARTPESFQESYTAHLKRLPHVAQRR